MKPSIVRFDGSTSLDVVSAYEVLTHVPEIEIEFATRRPGVGAADFRRLSVVAYRALRKVEHTDILCVPGARASCERSATSDSSPRSGVCTTPTAGPTGSAKVAGCYRRWASAMAARGCSSPRPSPRSPDGHRGTE